MRSGDELALLLGMSNIVVLRPTSGSQYMVVGVCICPAFDHGQALLGDLQKPWDIVHDYRYEDFNKWSWAWCNRDTGEIVSLDPRINWQDLQVEETDSRRSSWLSQQGRGNLRPPDTEYFTKRGVPLQDIELV